MTNETGLRNRLEVSVHLPGTRGVSCRIPAEMLDAPIEKAIQHVLDGSTNGEDKDLVKAIRHEIGISSLYTVFAALGNEQYAVDRQQPVGKLFEVNPVTREPEYRQADITVSSPRKGGYSR